MTNKKSAAKAANAENVENVQDVQRVDENTQTVDLAVSMPDVDAILSKLDDMEDSVPITCQSKEFTKQGEKGNYLFLGLSDMTFNAVDKDTGEETKRTIPAVKFCDSKKDVFINAGVDLVDQLKSLEIVTPVSIEYIGKIKKVKKYKICLLS